MTQAEAKMVAKELYRLMKADIIREVREVAEQECDDYLSAPDAARLIGWKLQTLYNRKDEVPHFKTGKHLRFSKRALMRYISERR